MAKIVKSDLRHTIQWRDSLKFIDYSYDEFVDFLSQTDKQYIFSEKLDGELNSLVYEKNSDPYFITKSSVIHDREYPILKEYKDILDKMDNIHDTVIMGELKAFDSNVNIPFNRSQSIIRTGDVNLVHHFPFDIYRLNGKNTNSDLVTLEEMFQHGIHIKSPRWIFGGVDEFKELWQRVVIEEKGEGIVVVDPLNKNIRYRIKHVLTADVVIVSAGNQNGLAWAKGQIGYLKLAILDENNNFLLTSKVGTGFLKTERIELFDYFNKNCIERKDGDLWVPPVLITEVKYRRHRFNKVPLLKYENNKYIELGEGDGVTMDQTSFVRFRDDKRLLYNDLSINQFPI